MQTAIIRLRHIPYKATDQGVAYKETDQGVATRVAIGKGALEYQLCLVNSIK